MFLSNEKKLMLKSFFLDLSEMGRMEKQFLKHLEQLDAEKKVTVDGYASFYHIIAK